MASQTIITIFGLLVVFCMCLINPGNALKCYSCFKDGPHPNVTCVGSVKNCTSEATYCNTYSINGSLYEFTRDCVTEKVCKPGYCKTQEDILGKRNCQVRCCNTDLCNSDVITTTPGAPSAPGSAPGTHGSAPKGHMILYLGTVFGLFFLFFIY